MAADPVLKKAIILSRRKKYDAAIKMLEAEVFRYQDSFNYYYVLGTSCLYAGDFGGAFTYFNRAKNIKMRDPRTLLALAVLFLRRGETDKALDLYLDVQDLDPDNPTSRRALAIIRRHGGTESLETWLEKGKLISLYPPLPKAGLSFNPFPLALVLGAAALGTGVFLGMQRIPVEHRGGLDQSALEDEEEKNPVETEAGGSYQYILTGDQVISYYTNARKFFTQYRDEAAKRELNRLLESNASAAVKNKARLLMGYTVAPGFDTLKDRFSYEEVFKEPALYRDCYVLWRGTAANLENKPDKTSFDLLVGYDGRQVLEGIVPVELHFPAAIQGAAPLEVLGQIILLPGNARKFMLAGASVHQAPEY
ncbi:MAG: tetratricopeptide repeat protein [Spirochaetaceae bacterium]|jgi:tetratricopeptide (TPR) repeat protein|nr:tetratricopeptide repeat protein [Spirochaetaceae bacterium]